MAVNKRNGSVFCCTYCGKEFFVPQYEINYRKNIKYCSQECYHLSARKERKKRKCLQCGTEFVVEPKHKNKKFCGLGCAYTYKRAQDRKATVGSDGYKYVWFSDGSGESEHRYIMEQKIGRKLNRNEVVHHIDGNRINNDPSNLIIMSWGEHSAFHRKLELEKGRVLFGGGKNVY